MFRHPRSAAARRKAWAQIGISALVLLLPPIVLGGAVYALLPGRDDAPAPQVPNVIADAHAAATNFHATGAVSAATPPVANTQPAAVAPPSLPVASKPAPIPSAPPAFSLASSRHEPPAKAATREPAGKDAASRDIAGKDGASKDAVSKNKDNDTVKDPSRVLGPVPVRVTVVVPPGAPPPAAAAPVATAPAAPDSESTASVNLESPRIAAAEPPAMPAPIIEPPLIAPPRSIASQRAVAPIELPEAETPPPPATAGAGRRHSRYSYLRRLARRSDGYYAEARYEARAARPAARSDQGFSLRNWLSNTNTAQPSRQRNAHN
jgi:hypothetical protein